MRIAKEQRKIPLESRVFDLALLAGMTPIGSMVDHPIREGCLKANVPARFFGLDPLVPKNLAALGKEFAIKR